MRNLTACYVPDSILGAVICVPVYWFVAENDFQGSS